MSSTREFAIEVMKANAEANDPAVRALLEQTDTKNEVEAGAAASGIVDHCMSKVSEIEKQVKQGQQPSSTQTKFMGLYEKLAIASTTRFEQRGKRLGY